VLTGIVVELEPAGTKTRARGPAGTVTFAGAVAAPVFELASDTTAPPAGADALNIIVPVDEAPLGTDDGFTDTPESVATAGVTVGSPCGSRPSTSR
jgi:hypothetical protein